MGWHKSPYSIVIVKEAKRAYFSEQINENKDKPQNLWKVLKNLGCLTKTKCSISSCMTLTVDGKEVNKKADIANHFNTYFTSVEHKLVEKLLHCPRVYGHEYIQDLYSKLGVTSNSFPFNSVSVEKLC